MADAARRIVRCNGKGVRGEPPCSLGTSLRGRVVVGSPEDIAVAEVHRTLLLLSVSHFFLLLARFLATLHSFHFTSWLFGLRSLSTGGDRLLVQFLAIVLQTNEAWRQGSPRYPPPGIPRTLALRSRPGSVLARPETPHTMWVRPGRGPR